MNVEATELKNHLADYLAQIRASGESITICTGTEPVATLAPISAPLPHRNGNLIDRLLDAPAPAADFQPLTREQIYERR
jgi:antitoxin (DNA-binding transcriptional repressor) of toxin-antitoxin stability system